VCAPPRPAREADAWISSGRAGTRHRVLPLPVGLVDAPRASQLVLPAGVFGLRVGAVERHAWEHSRVVNEAVRPLPPPDSNNARPVLRSNERPAQLGHGQRRDAFVQVEPSDARVHDERWSHPAVLGRASSCRTVGHRARQRPATAPRQLGFRQAAPDGRWRHLTFLKVWIQTPHLQAFSGSVTAVGASPGCW
jgi:hypothetical protein